MALVRTDNFSGIPLFYDRHAAGSYGNSAVRMRPFIDQTFLAECEECFLELQTIFSSAGFEISEIWSGGVGREGTGASLHHKNRAFDLDALIFSNGGKWVADTFPSRPYIYLAIEACLRMHFGTVLNFDFNRAHEDHFHFDNGRRVGLRTDTKSHSTFVQHCLTKLFEQSIGSAGVDGVFGQDTRGALNRARSRLGIGPLSDLDNWKRFLRICAEEALAKEASIHFAS